MKKFTIAFLCLILCFLCACSATKNSENNSVNSQINDEIVDSNKYYRIYKDNMNVTNYEIFNSNGETVLSEITDKPIQINMINNNIIDISIGMGAGISIHKYYNISDDIFSDEFLYVINISEELIAYIDVADEQSFKNRKLVVQNVFDKSIFYKEFQLDFSDIDTPVIKAEFSKDNTLLNITYLSGENQIQVTESLNLLQ